VSSLLADEITTMRRLLRNCRSLQIALVVFALGWCADGAEPAVEAPSPDTAIEPADSGLEGVTIDPATTTFPARGIVRPVREITVRSPVAARVTHVAVEPGQSVERDQLLVEFDATAQKYREDKALAGHQRVTAELAQLREALKRVRDEEGKLREPIRQARSILNELDRRAVARRAETGTNHDVVRAPLRDLNRDRVSDSFAQAVAGRTRLQSEIARIEQLSERLEETQTASRVAWKTGHEAVARYSRATAPISGLISECQVDCGELVSPGDELLRIIQTDRVKILLWIHPHRLPNGAHAVAAHARPTGAAGLWATAKTVRISNLPHPRTGQYLAEFDVDNRASSFQSGQLVEARVTLKNEPRTK
jgi:multidrug efflux pump subunit AcrA (membrane-fusion protein)